MFKTSVLTCVLLAAVSVTARAAEPAKAPGKGKDVRSQIVYLDPAKAGSDYAVQGEYAGDLAGGKGQLGAQVIALGDDEFTVVLLDGGLPGAGWDGKPRVTTDAKREGDIVKFDGNGYAGQIANGTLTGSAKEGGAFKLTKTDRTSPRESAKAPEGAIVLFDGSNIDAWEKAKMDDRHLIETGTKTKRKFQDFKLHVEFLLPFKPFARDQERGNSGIYIQDRYEIQVLDTFGHPEEFNGCASAYRQTPPKVNMCFPPLRWQTYDIDFTAARFDAEGKKTANAHVTVNQNGVIVQDNTELPTKTGAGQKEGPEPGPIQLQGHGNPVFFRNIWIVEKK